MVLSGGGGLRRRWSPEEVVSGGGGGSSYGQELLWSPKWRMVFVEGRRCGVGGGPGSEGCEGWGTGKVRWNW